MKLISWNVNGLRAISKKGFLNFLETEKPDILALQEIKCRESDLTEAVKNPPGYRSYFNSAEKSGYSGVAIYTKIKPEKIINGMGIERFDTEGRVIEAEFDDFTLLNVYFPNGKMSPQRLNYKLDFYEAILLHLKKLKDKNLIIVGDYNTAHKEIDLARPKENESVSGFLKIERALLDRLVVDEFVDVFRNLNKNPGQYTWWSMRTAARKRNVGWRIDYAFANKNLIKSIKSCTHLTEVMGSDHCPINIVLKIIAFYVTII